ncbi:hypothetical protein BDN72DRAFT_901558 [Pluteus cervinus]|uniref:Uncharacterized protein n=1 Tax=Pluteus cervinus TaxID=181527 RepID=A0ACD3AFT6_9AGAR|nr:hypothetical protein BDN72DRAFT_901558 [Pluteus cervinus]
MRFLFSLPLLALSLLFCGLNVSGSPTLEGDVARRSPAFNPLTNAQRLARGLPPNPPVRRTGAVLKPSPSPVPGSKYYATIEARTDDGKTVAKLGQVDKGIYRFLAKGQSPAKVSFSLPTSNSGSNLRLTDVNTNVPEFPIIGLVVGDGNTDQNIRHGSSNYLQFVGIKTGTSPNSTPQFIPNSYSDFTKKPQVAESDVWSIDLKTLTLTPQWINTDGSKPDVHILIANGNFFVTGDVQEWTKKNGSGTSVKLVLVWA